MGIDVTVSAGLFAASGWIAPRIGIVLRFFFFFFRFGCLFDNSLAVVNQHKIVHRLLVCVCVLCGVVLAFFGERNYGGLQAILQYNKQNRDGKREQALIL